MTAFARTGPISYGPLTLPELAALELPQPEWVVHELLPRGSLTLLAGREKSGKSLLATDLAACVAGGETFLDRAVQPGPVLLIPAEENLRDVWLRLERRLRGRTDLPIHVMPVNRREEEVLDLARPECLEALERIIVDLEPATVILDPMRELHLLNENDSDQMGPLMRPLRHISHQNDTGIVLLHHMSRSGNFRGSTAIRAAADQEWAFRRPEELDWSSTDLVGTLTVEGRFGPRQRLGIRLGEDLRWQLSVQALASSPSARAQVIEHLVSTKEPMSAHQIAAHVGAEVKTVQNVIAEERLKGVPIVTHGTGRKNDPFRYSLVEAS